MHVTKPTATQARLIRYFNGDPQIGDKHRPPSQATYNVCERNGWIEQVDEWPYYRATPKGSAAIEAASGCPQGFPDVAHMSREELEGEVVALRRALNALRDKHGVI